ncbi:Gfo/Idh/MocA family oxidoreductase [Algoriphagus aestuarii]|nr:Gfo/Idh/MocA family oxidoreductase [Algoriphagus aestuarii]
MKVLLKGFGSIGKRHTTNLLALGISDVSIITSKTKLSEGFEHLNRYQTIEQALKNTAYTHGFICSPTAFHLEDLNSFMDAGIKNIYLEKPISHKWNDLERVLDRMISEKVRIQVGFDLHFDPGIRKVKEILDSGKMGKVYSVNAFVGQYLPDWRPLEDHRKGMSASIEKGGGVMLDLVHEFDYLRWLLGFPKKIGCFYQKNPELEIETEDLADVLIQFENGCNATIHLDYHQRKLIRFCIITCENGTVKWDLAERTVSLVTAQNDLEKFDFSGFERNDRYLQIVDAFMNNPVDDRLTSFQDGLISLKMVLESKTSSINGTINTF